MKNTKLFITLCLILLPIKSQAIVDIQLHSHNYGVWALGAEEGTERWVVIHNLSEGIESGIYHIEVLEKYISAKPWHFRRLASHIAITESALLNSVKSKKRKVYPETFNFEYQKWLKSNDKAVCKSNILNCL